MKMKDKEQYTVSNSIVFRQRTPTNPRIADFAPSMTFDYSRQMPVMPDGDANTLVESTQTYKRRFFRTMNETGKPFALMDTEIGGSPDTPSRPFIKRSIKG